MATGKDIYQDSQGAMQSSGSCSALTSVSATNCGEPTHLGWYSEGSVQHVLYEIFAPATAGGPSVGLGIQPIVAAMQDEIKSTRALTSIFPFAAAVKQAGQRIGN